MWVWIDEFIGKGLDILTIVKFLGLLSTTLVPIALPLGILFASIMTFGNLGETSELVAIKSSGISIERFTRPLFLFIVLVSCSSFLFNNYVIPIAQLKATKMLYDIQNKKPVLAIKAGTFNKDIQNHTIYISSKDPDDKTVHGIKIYDHTSGKGDDKITMAEKGQMYISEDKRYLIFELENGWRYEEKEPRGKEDRELTRLGFKYWKKVFDLSDFAKPQTDESYFKNMRAVMNVQQIAHQIDTCKKNKYKLLLSNVELLTPAISVLQWDTMKNKKALPILAGKPKRLVDIIPDSIRRRVLSSAEISVRSIKSMLEINKQNVKLQELNLTEHFIELHKRFTLPSACILLFIIGAALGSIIRKGGLGMPFITAVIFFIIYYFMNTIGENMAKEMAVSVPAGMWVPSLILALIGAFLMYKANSDSPLFNKELYFKLFRFIQLLFYKKSKNGSSIR